ncbi:WD repeat-containing protein 13 [Clonorchis sinensis]|uniref:WD repeat-containing protein 13 n=1 Tax=Clonorchis sinensis TaxID=79923 RepID=H2KVE8_CLOSI|nr:WD repeat-containing protein 13 [Clonorchis sinensis]
MEQKLAGLRSESVPDLHGTSDVWQQILALDTRFGHLRPSMCGDSNMQRTLYLRRRHQLSKEQTRSSQVTHASHDVDNNAPKRDLYKCFREQLLISLYGHAPSLQFSSNTHSVEQSKSVAGSPKPESFSGSQYNKFTDDESCHSVGHTISRAKETLAEGYAFSGIEHIFDHHTGAVNRIRFANNDNTRLAIASMDGTISICSTWPPSQAKRVLLLLSGGHQRGTSITDLAWSLSNDTLVSTALDGSVCLWDTASGRLIRVYCAQTVAIGPVLVCAYQPQNYNLLVVGGAWGAIQTINLSTGKTIKKGRDQIHFIGFKSHKLPAATFTPFAVMGQGCVTALTFEAASGTCLWAGTDRGVIQAYSCQPENGRLIRTHRLNLHALQTSTSTAVPLLTSPSGLHEDDLDISSADLTRGNGRLKRSNFVQRLSGSQRSSSKFPSITSLSAHSWLSRETGDSYLLANAARLGLVLFQVTSNTGSLSMKRRFPIYHEPPDSHSNRSLRLLHSCFAPLVSFRSGACAVTASEDSNVYVFDVLYNGSHRSHCVSGLPAGLVTVLQGHMAPVLDVAIAWDESVLASADEGGAVIVWRRLGASDEAIE